MRCSKCNKPLRKGAKYCPACGAKVRKKSGVPFTVVLLVVMILLLLIALGWLGGILVAKCFGGSRSSYEKSSVMIQNAEEAISHAKKMGKTWGYENALEELTEKNTATIDGDSYYRLQQNYQGIPVYGKTIVYATDGDGNVTFVTGNALDIADTIELNPAITLDQAMQAVNTYLSTEFGTPEIEQKFTNEQCTLCIYSAENGTSPKLAYSIETNSLRFMVDAQNGVVLSSNEKTLDAIAYSSSDASQRFGYAVEQKDDGSYVMRNPEKRVSVWDLQGKSSKVSPNLEEATAVSSQDNIFGNSENESGYDQALILFSNIAIIAQHFSDLCNFEYEEIFIFINDGYYNGLNATGGIFTIDSDSGGYVGQIAVGNAIDYNDLEVFAHEYGHLMSFKHVGWIDADIESRAVNEGLSDIFGELYIAALTGSTDWYMDVNYKTENILLDGALYLLSGRNISNPSDTGNAESFSEYSNSKGAYTLLGNSITLGRKGSPTCWVWLP